MSLLTIYSQLPPGFEYVPVNIPYYLQVHNETDTINDTFLFDSLGIEERPHSTATVPLYPLLVAAYFAFADPLRYDQSTRANTAYTEVRELIRLYARKPGPKAPNVRRTEQAILLKECLGQANANRPHNTASGSKTMATIPESSNVAGEDAMVDELHPPESSTGIDTPSDGSTSGHMCQWDQPGEPVHVFGADLESDGEVPITPAMLLSRSKWRPVESENPDIGSMRFASSSDFVFAPSKV